MLSRARPDRYPASRGALKQVAKGVLIAFGVMVVSLLIPLAHFVLAPASPFIGGYFGISHAASHSGSPPVKSLIFGCLLGSLVFFVLAMAAAIVTVVAEDGRILWIMWGGVAVLTLYTASMSGLGAMFYQLRSGPVKTETTRETGS